MMLLLDIAWMQEIATRRASRKTVLPKDGTRSGVVLVHGVYMAVFVFFHNHDSCPDQGHRFVELGKERIHHPLVLTLEYRFPMAPAKPSKTGRLVRLWFTMNTYQEDGHFYILGEPVLLIERVVWLRGLINGLIAQGTPAGEIVLCGLHQSAVMLGAAVVLLQEIQLGGVVMVSGFVPNVETLQGWITAQGGPEKLKNTATPLLMIHGSNDHRMDSEFRRKVDSFFLDLGYSDYRTAEAIYFDKDCKLMTDGMWMFVWQFVIRTLGGES